MGIEFSSIRRKDSITNYQSATEPVAFSIPKPYTPSYRHSLTNMTVQIDKNIYSETTDYPLKWSMNLTREKLTIHLINAKRLSVRHGVTKTDGHSRGQLHLSLQYLSDGRVVLNIIKAQDILHFEKTCYKEYYVKVCHIYTNRKLKTKRSSPVEGKRNMVFGCSFSFDISVSDLSDSCLVVSLVNYGMVRGSRSVGRLILGPYVMKGESERRHWGKMIAAPNQSLSQWHSLYL